MSKSRDKRLAALRGHRPVSVGIKRFHIRDGYVLDEDENGSVVRYDHHIVTVAALEDEIKALCAHRDSLEAKCEQLEADIDELYEKYTKLEGGDDE